MIICTEHILQVGERRCGPMMDMYLNVHVVAFVVLKEVTEADYLQYAAENSDIPPTPFELPMRFYVVAMD